MTTSGEVMQFHPTRQRRSNQVCPGQMVQLVTWLIDEAGGSGVVKCTGWPYTSPTPGSASSTATARASEPGVSRSSASSRTRYWPWAWARPSLKVATARRLVWWAMTCTRASARASDRASSRLPSDDRSSTMITSTSTPVWSRAEVTQARR